MLDWARLAESVAVGALAGWAVWTLTGIVQSLRKGKR